jgi:pyrimidine-specific ribonucleoside hydrolase
MEKRIPVIIDCDPGHDDAIALVMACCAKNIDVLAVTTVCGNQTVDKTTLNALKILDFLGRRVPVASGAVHPLLRPLVVAAEVHGESGLGGVQLPEPVSVPEKKGAVQMMKDVLESSACPITMVCTAPLTNMALLLSAYPELKRNIARICLMGGGLGHGNKTAAAEFNIYVDPEAADIVFSSGVPIVMCGLDMTETALMTMEEIREFSDLPGKVAGLAADIFRYYADYYRREGFPGIALHDPTVIAYLMRPGLFTTEDMYVRVETQGGITTGMTFADRRIRTDKPAPNVKVCTGINRTGFIALVKACCLSYEGGTSV